MIIMRADEKSEAGIMPSEKILAAMGNYNEELVKAGIMKAGEGLHPTSKGARVEFRNGKANVVNGPFPANESIAGFWLWEVKSFDEAIRWVKRLEEFMGDFAGPDSMLPDAVIEVRQIFEADDFGEEFTPELRAQEERQRAAMEKG
jgi:hypothetical protein